MNAPYALAATVRRGDLRNPAEAARIETFVAALSGSVFHRPLWLRAVEQGTQQRACGLIAERDGVIVGWLPLTEVHSPLFGRALVSSGFAVGGGVLTAESTVAEQLCEAAKSLALSLSCPGIELRGPATGPGWEERRDSHCGFVGPIAADDEAQLLAIPRKHRAEVRKGLAGGLEVTTGRDEAERSAHYAVYAESVRNLGTPVFPRSLFDAVLDLFGPDADILTVRAGGVPVASVLSLYHQGAVLPYWGGGVRAARQLRANELMYFTLMGHARSKGCTTFDFGRSKTGSGPYHYKRNWGFEPQPLEYAHWTAPGAKRRDADPTSPAFARKIAVWQRLPLPIANKIGPWIARGLA